MTRAVIAVVAVAAAALAAAAPSAAPHPACAMTLPTSVARASFGPAGFNYGTRKLRVGIWKGGRLVADGSWATLNADGSIEAKQGWWRGVPGRLTISGRRIDSAAPPLRAHVPRGYGARGFTPSGLTFPTEGCWRVTGKVGQARLSYVVLVAKP